MRCRGLTGTVDLFTSNGDALIIFAVWVVAAVFYLRLFDVDLGTLARLLVSHDQDHHRLSRFGDTYALPVEDQNRTADLLREWHTSLLQAAGDYDDNPVAKGIRDEADRLASRMQLFGGAFRMTPDDSPSEIEEREPLPT